MIVRIIQAAVLILGSCSIAQAKWYDPYNTVVNKIKAFEQRTHFAKEVKEWADQIQTLREQLNEARKLYQTTDTLYRIAKDPSSIIESMSTFRGATRELDRLFGTEGTGAMYDLATEMNRFEREVDATGRTIERSAMFGNNDRPRRTSLSGAGRLMKRWYNQMDDVFEFTKDQEEELRKQIAKRVEDMNDIDPNDPNAQNKAAAIQAEIHALQTEIVLLNQRAITEGSKVQLVRYEQEDKRRITTQAMLRQSKEAGAVAREQHKKKAASRNDRLSTLANGYAGTKRTTVQIK